MKKSYLVFLLFLIAVVERTVFDLGPNVELITAGAILGALYFGARTATLVVLATLIVSDLVIGNSSIFVFTWSGFAIPVFVGGLVLKSMGKMGSGKRIGMGTLAGVGTNLFFFFWTNFGVWLLEPSNMYTNDLGGLVLSYINGLPFLKLQLLSTLAFVPIAILLTELAIKLNKNFNSQSQPSLKSHLVE